MTPPDSVHLTDPALVAARRDRLLGIFARKFGVHVADNDRAETIRDQDLMDREYGEGRHADAYDNRENPRDG